MTINFFASQLQIRIERMAFGLMVKKWGILARPLTIKATEEGKAVGDRNCKIAQLLHPQMQQEQRNNKHQWWSTRHPMLHLIDMISC